MSEDKELLELAAKAAGIDYYQQDSMGNLHEKKGGTWNPLNDDGDALRLAVKLGITIVQVDDGKNDAGWWMGGWKEVLVEPCEDPYTATRRAIVRAAAEIGRGM